MIGELQENTDSKTKNNMKKIIIKLEAYKCIMPLYSISDIKTTVMYLGTIVGESRPIPVTDDDNLIINETFEIEVDGDSIEDIDRLASNPLVLMVAQSPGTMDVSVYEQLKQSPDKKLEKQSVDSLISKCEMLTGVKTELEIPSKDSKEKEKLKANSNKRERARSNSKSSKSLRSKTKASKSTRIGEETKSTNVTITDSYLYGVGAVDLIPLLYREHTFTETIAITPVRDCCRTLTTYKYFPQIAVTIAVANNEKIVDINNVLNFTVESIFNVPDFMLSGVNCKVCAWLPLGNNSSHPVLFKSPKMTREKPLDETEKRWAWTYDEPFEDTIKMKYFLNYGDVSDVKNKANLNLKKALDGVEPRLEFNCMKRNILYKDTTKDFAFRNIVLEIFLNPNGDPNKVKHLMALVDLSSSLLPGCHRIRLATPIRTFALHEASKIAGIEKSYFDSELKPQNSESKSNLNIAKKKREKNTSKSSKKDEAEEINVVPKLPETEPSVIVYGDDGNPCFMIVETELLTPISPKRNLEDLTSDFHQLRSQLIGSSEEVVTVDVASEFYKRTLSDIIKDLRQKYDEFSSEKLMSTSKEYKGFIEFLQKSGAYQTYVTSVSTAIGQLVTKKYHYNEQDLKSSKTYQRLISEVFSSLISDMHSVLNSFVGGEMKAVDQKQVDLEELFFCAKEAAEAKRYDLADRYFLERILNGQQQNSSVWFDYAIYNLEVDNRDKAFECIKEAVARQSTHKYSLILLGILLAEKGQMWEAETCFLNVMAQKSKWLEGWGVLYLFYRNNNREDDMDLALEIAQKYIDDPVDANDDYFTEFEDLAWSTTNLPKTLFFRTTVLLIKMRIYSWAESALAQELTIPKYYGMVNYLLSVISYYKGNYPHALEHIEQCKESYGCSFEISSLSGHCFFALEKYEEAKTEYHHVIESFSRPDNIRLVYLNCALAMRKLNQRHKALKLILLTCKRNQTAYVWMNVGILYYELSDFISAEECFLEANVRDNTLAEVWGYLTLINIKWRKIMEAEQCYQLAVKCKLRDETLLTGIQNEFRKCSK